jgi:hypothetical protein
LLNKRRAAHGASRCARRWGCRSCAYLFGCSSQPEALLDAACLARAGRRSRQARRRDHRAPRRAGPPAALRAGDRWCPRPRRNRRKTDSRRGRHGHARVAAGSSLPTLFANNAVAFRVQAGVPVRLDVMAEDRESSVRLAHRRYRRRSRHRDLQAHLVS